MTRFSLRTLAAAALALAAGSAAATAASSAGMSGFSFALYDLDLADGIAPAIDFSEISSGGSHIYANVNSAIPDYIYLTVQAFGALPGTPLGLSFGAPSGYGTVHGEIVGGGDVPTFESMSVGGIAKSTATYSHGYEAWAEFPFRGFSGFTLSAHTRVEFCVTATVNAETTIGQDGSGLSESARAGVQLGVWEVLPDGGMGGQDSEAGLEVGLYGVRGNVFNQSLLKTSLLNATDGAMEAQYHFSVGARGSSGFYPAVAAVPEPATYAMLLPGLALAGALARRRRCRHAPCCQGA